MVHGYIKFLIRFIKKALFSIKIMDYKDMLKKAREDMPESIFIKERFEIPNVKGHIQGNKTVISNINQIANDLGRPVAHLVKFVLRELATPGTMKGTSLIVGTKLPASRFNEKIRQYANEFVLCNECGKPDTKIEKSGNVSYLKCTACGTRQQVRSRI